MVCLNNNRIHEQRTEEDTHSHATDAGCRKCDVTRRQGYGEFGRCEFGLRYHLFGFNYLFGLFSFLFKFLQYVRVELLG